MLIKLPPASTPTLLKDSKPPLHTRKNHDSYNGTLHMPLATHTQYLPASGSSSPYYLITLFYPHNRACTLFRSPADLLTLRQGLATADADPTIGEKDEDDDHINHGEKNDSGEVTTTTTTTTTAATDVTAATITAAWCHACASSCSCACACACPGDGSGEKERVEARSAREVNRMLGEAVEKVRAGREGSGEKVVVEWFLRRRFGDCEGGDGVE